jgi:2-phosphoglycerate kinase
LRVSNELFPALKAVVDRHIEDELPVIIDGDFINPELLMSFDNSHKIKFIYLF